jgi:hypothetical protein
MDNPNNSKDNCEEEVESDIEKGNSIEDSESSLQWEVSATPNVPGLIWPTRKSKRQAEKVLVKVTAIETRRNKGLNNTQDRMCQCFNSFFMYHD